MTARICRAMRLCLPGLLLASIAAAQNAPQTLVSIPPRAELRLDGPLRITGQSPLRLEEPLRGEFILTADRPGFVRQKARLFFPDNGGPGVPSGTTPVNSFGGLVRTLALPGVGQWAQGEHGQGAVLLGAEIAAVGMLLKSDADVREGLRGYDLAVDRLSRSDGTTLTATDQVNLRVAVAHFQDQADDAKAARKRWAIMAIGAWGYSVVDQAFLRGGLEVRSSGFDTLRIRMERVSRGQAVLRSLFVPGSGQGYAGHPGRSGWLLLGAATLSGFALSAEHHLDRTLSLDGEAQLRYNELRARTGDVNLLSSARDDLQGRYSDARSARRVRNVLWFSTAALWGLNVVDAAVMDIPEGDGRFSALPTRSGLFANVIPGDFRLGYRRGF